jgi:hypothetical protein
MYRESEQNDPSGEGQTRTKQRSQSIDASMSESLSMSGSRDAAKAEKEDRVRPSPCAEDEKVYDHVINPALREKKPWLWCGIGKWERFLYEPTHAYLLGAAAVEHNKEEWMQLYDRCAKEDRQDDIVNLRRLICAQTRAMNEGSNNKMLFPRAGEAELYVTNMYEVAKELDRWRSDKLPWQRKNTNANESIEAELPLPNDLVRILECDSLTAASDLKMLSEMQHISIAMVCSCGNEPRGRVLQGEQGQQCSRQVPILAGDTSRS